MSNRPANTRNRERDEQQLDDLNTQLARSHGKKEAGTRADVASQTAKSQVGVPLIVPRDVRKLRRKQRPSSDDESSLA